MKTRIISTIALLCASASFASTQPDFDIDSFIKDVSYLYEISPDLPWMCMGTLSVTFEIPENTEKLIFYSTRIKRDPPKVFNSTTYPITGESSITVSVDNMMHHAYFSALFYINGNPYRTSNFSVKDYIAPEDLEELEMLLSQNKVEDVSTEEPFMEIFNRMVSIRCDSVLDLTINTIVGKTIFKERVDRYAEIPLNPGIYILTYRYNKKTFTKKIMIK